MWALIENGLEHNGLITAFAFVGVIMWVSVILSKRLTFGRIHGSAIAIVIGLVLAWVGGTITGGSVSCRAVSTGGRTTGAEEDLTQRTLKAAVGYTRFASGIRDQGVPNYVDYSVGVGYDFGDGVSLGAAVAGATKKDFFGDGNKARLIVTLSKTL